MIRTFYVFLEAFAKQNQENSVLVLIFYSYFQQHLGFGLGAGHCLIRVLSTNQHLLQIINTSSFELSRPE